MTNETTTKKRVKKSIVDVMPTMIQQSIYPYDSELTIRYVKDVINHVPNTMKLEQVFNSEGEDTFEKILTVRCYDGKWYQLAYNDKNEVTDLYCQYEKIEATFAELPDYIKDAVNKSNSIYVDKVYKDNDKRYFLHLDQYYTSLSSFMITQISNEYMFNILVENNRFILKF